MVDMSMGDPGMLGIAPSEEGELTLAAPGERYLGTVKMYVSKRGFGIIDSGMGDGKNKTLFVHWSEVKSTDKWPQLEVGMVVEYTPGETNGKPSAIHVTQPGGMPFAGIEPSTESRVLSEFYATGEVESFNAGGFGFLKTTVDLPWPREIPAGAKVYVSREDVIFAEGSAMWLVEGLQVQFRVFETEKGLGATECMALGGAPIIVDRAEVPLHVTSKGKGKGKGKDAKGGKFSMGNPILIGSNGKINLTGFVSSKGKSQWQGKGLNNFGSVACGGVMGVQRTIGKGTAGGPGTKNIPCKFFLQGRCSAGAQCSYKHGDAAWGGEMEAAGWTMPKPIKPPNQLVSGQPKEPMAPYRFPQEDETFVPLERKKPVECTFFQRNRCLKGAACIFAHGEEELEMIKLLQSGGS